jgi:multidrug efflux pump subunit AcrB
VASTDNPFDGIDSRPCLLVRLADDDGKRATREEILRTLRTKLSQEIPEARMGLRDLSGPGGFTRYAYPIDLAVSGPEPEPLQKMAQRLAERMSREDKLTDIRENPDVTSRPQLYVDVDRTKAKELGVALDDEFNTLQVFFGSAHVNDVNGFGRTWQVTLQVAGEFRDNPEKIKELKVRNAKGEMVPLGTVVAVRATAGPEAVNRLDGRLVVEITANPATGVSLAQVRTLSEALAGETRKELGLSDRYSLIWLGSTPAGERPR